MKIVVSANGAGLDAQASPVFGRCPTYVFVDTESMESESVENPAMNAAGGAGIQAAQFVVERGAQAVVSGSVGPNAFDVFRSAGVPIHRFGDGVVREAVEAFKAGRLQSSAGANVQAHAGMGMGRGGGRGMGIMRIALSADDRNGLDSVVSPHFGRCPFYVLVDIDGREVSQVDTVENPCYGQHRPGEVPGFIRDQGADVMLAGGMGRRAIGFFQQYGIQPVTGASGTVRHALEQYLGGTLQGAAPCRESVAHAHEAAAAGGGYEQDEAGRLREEVKMLEQQLAEAMERLGQLTAG